MTITKIEGLRRERKNKVATLEQRQRNLENDETLADKYRAEEIRTAQLQLKAVKEEYDPQITELIDQREAELYEGYHNAEYTGMTEAQVNLELLKEMRGTKETEILVKQYGNNQNELLKVTNELLEVNSPSASNHINALKTLGNFRGDMLEKRFKEQNLNDLQKAYKNDINFVQNQREEFRFERDGDPFSKILAKYE